MNRTAKAPPGAELFLGLVAAIGTDLDRVSEMLTGALTDVAYDAEVIRLSDLLREIQSGPPLVEEPKDVRYHAYMAKGTYLREQTGRGDALAVMAVRRIRRVRASRHMRRSEPTSRAHAPRSSCARSSIPMKSLGCAKFMGPGSFSSARIHPEIAA
jgi:hypothetical protein